MANGKFKTGRGRAKSPARAIGGAVEDIVAGRFNLAKFVALLVVLLSFFSAYRYAPGRIIGVADGDTVIIYTSERERLKVRLYGVDAPEGGQPWGGEAESFVRGLAWLQEVELRVLSTDQYGRAVALVKLPDGRSLNEELVRRGHAWVYRDYCKEYFCGGWLRLEKAARENKNGLWSEPSPTAPWNWRKRRN